jgi:hypothetical protein
MTRVPALVLVPALIFAFHVTPLQAQQLESAEGAAKEWTPPELAAYRINPHPPSIDGQLDDAIWHRPHLQSTKTFTQVEPDEGKVPTESTTVAVAYDQDAMYVAFWCYDSDPREIDHQLVRRDRQAESDRVSVCVDAFHDHQTCARFEVTAAGVQTDTRIFDDNNGDPSWDAVWESGVTMQPWGWSAEMRIPYHALRFSDKQAHTWGINFTRNINRKNEYLKWSFTPASKGGFVSNFGHLTGVTGIHPSGHLEVLPYVVSSARAQPPTVGNPDGRDLSRNAGFDFKYGLSSNLTLDATVNPDFGQVELDRPVLNLSTYETFFQEKRPFFLEGADLFQTDFNLFYSRRIGRSPRGSVDDPEFGFYTDYPGATTILGAGKLTGKLAGGTSIAVLGAVTEQESARYGAVTNVVLDSVWRGDTLETSVVSADTVYREGVVEPTATYNVLRLKQDVLGNSSVGALLTFAGQKGRPADVTGGFDWRLRTADNGWGIRGQAVFSRTGGNLTGYGIDMTLEKSGGKHWRGAVGGTLKDPTLRLNRLGFASRVNSRSVWSWLQYRTTDDWWIVRNSFNNLNLFSSWNYDGINYQMGGNFNTYVELRNFWSFGGGVEIQGEKFSDEELRGNGLWEWPVHPTMAWWSNIETDRRKRVSFNWNPGGGADRGGRWMANYVGVQYRPKSNLEFETGVNYRRHRDGRRWVANVGDSSVFADLNLDEVFLHASASAVFSRNLSVQLSAEGLVSGLDYQTYRYYLGGNRYSDPISGFNSDFNSSTLNSTLLLRWEYRPGSTLYLVWTRSRGEFDDTVNNLALSRDLRRLFAGNADNVFLVKASYWLNM